MDIKAILFDLDGTLLRSDETTSEYTNKTINKLVEEGMIFSYATARSYVTARKVTKGLNANIPLIVYNGAMIVDNRDGSILWKNFFGEDVQTVLNELFEKEVYPIVYAFVEGVETDENNRGVRVGFKDGKPPEEVDVVVLTIPQAVAQDTANHLMELGIRGFWNFTNVEISVPEPVFTENVHFVDTLLTLSYRISHQGQ